MYQQSGLNRHPALLGVNSLAGWGQILGYQAKGLASWESVCQEEEAFAVFDQQLNIRPGGQFPDLCKHTEPSCRRKVEYLQDRKMTGNYTSNQEK